MLQGASIVCLSSIDWCFNQQIPQEAARALAEGGNRVLFIENTGVRAATMGDAPRLWARFRNWQRTRGKPTRTKSGWDFVVEVGLLAMACFVIARGLLYYATWFLPGLRHQRAR